MEMGRELGEAGRGWARLGEPACPGDRRHRSDPESQSPGAPLGKGGRSGLGQACGLSFCSPAASSPGVLPSPAASESCGPWPMPESAQIWGCLLALCQDGTLVIDSAGTASLPGSIWTALWGPSMAKEKKDLCL